MARHVSLRNLVPVDDDSDTIEMPDGKVFLLPTIGVREMSRLLMLDEDLKDSNTLKQFDEMQTRALNILRAANPRKKLPDYDLTVDQMLELIALISGTEGGAAQAVRDALSRDTTSGAATQEAAIAAARELAEKAGTAAEGEEAPLVSAKPSRKRSSRSATSGTGGRSGGRKSAGRSSSSTSKKRSASKTS